jgi:hypothetical protein
MVEWWNNGIKRRVDKIYLVTISDDRPTVVGSSFRFEDKSGKNKFNELKDEFKKNFTLEEIIV